MCPLPARALFHFLWKQQSDCSGHAATRFFHEKNNFCSFWSFLKLFKNFTVNSHFYFFDFCCWKRKHNKMSTLKTLTTHQNDGFGAQISLKPMQEDASRCVVFGGIADLSVRPLSVEFWRFEVSNRISVPMSYITFWYIWTN